MASSVARNLLKVIGIITKCLYTRPAVWVYSHFGPRPLRSLSTSVLCMRTELAKDRSDKGPKWMSRSVLRTEVETDRTKKERTGHTF